MLTIKPNPERKNNQILTPEKLLKNPKPKNSQILTSKKPLKNPERKNNQILTSKNRERIGIIRKELKELSYKLSKSELKEIKKRLYDIENKKGSLGSKKTRRYLNELDEKILKLDRYYHDYDDFEYKGIKNKEDLFRLSISEDYYKPKLVETGKYTKYESKGDKILTVEEFLSLIESHLAGMINDYKNKGEWKVQLIADINFISLKPGSDETRVMYTKSDNVEIRITDDMNDVIKELFKSLLKRYQENLREKMRGSEFGLDGVNLLYYDFNKISLNRGGSYIEPVKWIKDKRSIINTKNNDYKRFQYAITVGCYNSYKSKHNLNREEQVILLMISNSEK